MRWLTAATAPEVHALRDQGEFFWLDLAAPDQQHLYSLGDAMGLDAEAVERALRFGEPPSLTRFRGHVGMVFYGAEGDPAEALEVHVYASGDWVLTVTERRSTRLDGLRRELSSSPPADEEDVIARILGALADSVADLLDDADERVERLEEAAAAEGRPARELRADILTLRRRLIGVRRLVRRQRDYIDRAVEELTDVPGLEPSKRHDLRDVAGEMIRVSDRTDDTLDRLAAALDLLNSTVSNRLNAIIERLTVVATIFLPLTFVTGFFGQNFGWMVRHISSFGAFLGLGIGGSAVAGLSIWLWVRARLERAQVD